MEGAGAKETEGRGSDAVAGVGGGEEGVGDGMKP